MEMKNTAAVLRPLVHGCGTGGADLPAVLSAGDHWFGADEAHLSSPAVRE
jgi:hypothetical protein